MRSAGGAYHFLPSQTLRTPPDFPRVMAANGFFRGCPCQNEGPQRRSQPPFGRTARNARHVSVHRVTVQRAVPFAPPESHAVPRALLKGLRKAGRSFVCEMWREFSDWTPADAQLLRNGALDLDVMREAERRSNKAIRLRPRARSESTAFARRAFAHTSQRYGWSGNASPNGRANAEAVRHFLLTR
jgi:hypothetical protein